MQLFFTLCLISSLLIWKAKSHQTTRNVLLIKSSFTTVARLQLLKYLSVSTTDVFRAAIFSQAWIHLPVFCLETLPLHVVSCGICTSYHWHQNIGHWLVWLVNVPQRDSKSLADLPNEFCFFQPRVPFTSLATSRLYVNFNLRQFSTPST